MNKELTQLLIQTGSIGAIAVFVIKLLISEWMKKSEKLQSVKELAVENQILQLKDLSIEIKSQVKDLDKQFHTLRESLINVTMKLSATSEKMGPLQEAFKGFVLNSEKRFSSLETSTSQIQEIARDLIRVTEIKKKG